jgi:DinB superfamily
VPIAPDTKDWTWVLDQPCPECGFDARGFPRADIPQMIVENAAEWRVHLDRDDAAHRPRDDVWSPLEYACHVADVYRIYDGRLQLMLEHDDPLFPNWDQDATAVERDYAGQEPQQVVVEVRDAARRIAQRFATVEGAQWERRGRRSDGAHFTVESIARYMIHDVIHHLYDVR